jgi:hypothetical protein
MITQIDIRKVRRILMAHLRRGVASEEIALGKILADLAAWEKGKTPPALRPPPHAAPFDVPRRHPSDQDADDTMGVGR